MPIIPLFLALLLGWSVTTAHAAQPNIIFILADDLGWGDLGVFYQNERGQEGKPHHRTPNLDKLANGGLQMRRHYVPAPVCAPSRASLLLGVHQGHAGVRDNQFDKALEDNHTMATVLKEAGYATALVGKYGLQGEGNSPATWPAYPTKRGFDHFFGYVRHRDGHNHYPAHKMLERPPVELYSGDKEISGELQGCYTTDLFTAEAKRWITAQRQNNAKQPFFLYLAYDVPHAALEVPPGAYPPGGGLKGGVQWVGEKGRMINTAQSQINGFIHPDYAGQDWPEVYKRFATMVRRLDEAVGDVVQLLRDLEIEQETLIIFTSDNGPHIESYGYGQYAANFFNNFGPFDGIKRDTWEGGIRVPALAYWPGRIEAGRMDQHPSQFHDWLPTFAELAGVPAPANTDGVSLVPTLTGKGTQRESTIYVEYQEGRRTPDYPEFHESHRNQKRGQMQVLYHKGFKGVRYDVKSAEDDFRIYDTSANNGEEKDLARTSAQFAALQAEMKRRSLRVRRPNATAPRPYDKAPIPALSQVKTPTPGLAFRVFQVKTPWTPDIRTLRVPAVREGLSERFDITKITQENEVVVEFTGILKVPETGEYTFSLQTDRGAVMRLHEATVIDADKAYRSGREISAKVLLEKGYHPITLIYARNAGGEPLLKMQWNGPGLEKAEIPANSLFH